MTKDRIAGIVCHMLAEVQGSPNSEMTVLQLRAVPHAVQLPCNALTCYICVQGSLCCVIVEFSAGGCRATQLPTLTGGFTSEPEGSLSFKSLMVQHNAKPAWHVDQRNTQQQAWQSCSRCMLL